MNNPVFVRIEIENMRHLVTNGYMMHLKEIEDIANEEIKKAIDNLNFAEVIRHEATQVLSEAVRESIRRSLKEAISQGEIKNSIDAIARDALTNLLMDV